MNREILINDFLDRLQPAFSAQLEPCGDCEQCEDMEEESCARPGVSTDFDHEAARTALDRLFSDLRDFCGEIYADKGQMHEPTLLASLLKKRKGK